MKPRSIGKYCLVLVYVVFLLGGMIFFPDQSMAPPPLEQKPILREELKEIIKPRTGISPIRISGTVSIPDGRKLSGTTINIYHIEPPRVIFRLITKTTTNKEGFYSIGLGDHWAEKKIQVYPQYGDFGLGGHFSPANQIYQISSANITNCDFLYNGPLPDLRPVLDPSVDYSGFKVEGGKCFYYFTVKNLFGAKSGPCKARVKSIDKGPNLQDNLVTYKIVPVPSLIPGATSRVEVELGPAMPGDEGPPRGWMRSTSGSGRYDVESIRVDFFDVVTESNEENNHVPL